MSQQPPAKMFQILNDNERCADLPFPATEEGFQVAIGWLKVLTGQMTAEKLGELIAALGLPPTLVERLTGYATACIGQIS